MVSPFAPSTSKPGTGTIHLALLPPNTPVLQTLSYQYPLKLIAPSSTTSRDNVTIHTVFMLTYGGGLVAGDKVDLGVELEPNTRLVLLTQGSTKIFKTPERSVWSGQKLVVRLAGGSALCYLPDPVQPFAQSAFEQVQSYYLPSVNSGGDGGDPRGPANLCVCDWVSHGRGARGENWDFYKYVSRNEVWLDTIPDNDNDRKDDPPRKPQLVLRDNIHLDTSHTAPSLSLPHQTDHLGLFGTLLLHGPLFTPLSTFFLQEFKAQARIGGRVWGDEEKVDDEDDVVKWRKGMVAREIRDGVLWTAAKVRGVVVVKFGAREVEGGKGWLGGMLEREGSVERLFGEKALLCLK